MNMCHSVPVGRIALLPLLGALTCAAISGCGRRQPALAPTRTPEVVVSQPVVKTVTDYEDFSGRTQAVASVEVRARVSGYLDKVLFKEGYEVKQGDPLFEIDPRTYEAELKRAEANVRQSIDHLKRLQLDFKRAAELLPTHAISQEEYDLMAGNRDEGEAAVKVAEAARDLARLNVEFTKVTAPLSGRISRQLIDPGNMVKADETALTTIVALDPIYAYFDVDERTTLRVRRLIRAGKVTSSREAAMPVLLSLLDEDDFPHAGTINFVDNYLDAMAGTLRLRGVFPNPNRLLSPGMFVRIRLPIGKAREAVLVSERALGTDQGQSFVYVLDDEDQVVFRRVKLGSLQDGLRVVEEGLAKGDRVVVSGLQRIRPGVKVDPKPTEMSGPTGSPTPPLVTSPDPPSGSRPAS
jgi:RND family efflux transporter MFP subunit